MKPRAAKRGHWTITGTSSLRKDSRTIKEVNGKKQEEESKGASVMEEGEVV